MGDRVRQAIQRHWLRAGQVEALADRAGVLAAPQQPVGQVVDVDRVQPDLETADGPEPPLQDRPEERQKMEITLPVDEPGPGDDRRQASVARLQDRLLWPSSRRTMT